MTQNKTLSVLLEVAWGLARPDAGEWRAGVFGLVCAGAIWWLDKAQSPIGVAGWHLTTRGDYMLGVIAQRRQILLPPADLVTMALGARPLSWHRTGSTQ